MPDEAALTKLALPKVDELVTALRQDTLQVMGAALVKGKRIAALEMVAYTPVVEALSRCHHRSSRARPW